MTNKIYGRKANLLKALAHSLRLQIVDLLRAESITVSELSAKLNEVQANISRHLAILRNSGIIDYKKEGVKTFYFVKHDCIANLHVCLDEILKDRLKGDIDMYKKL